MKANDALPARNKNSRAKELLRQRYRPVRVKILFVGESPPASGRFFYQENSGLYRVIRDVFIKALPSFRDGDFLEVFRAHGCYLVDLCGDPVDCLSPKKRQQACIDGEVRLSKMLRELGPQVIVTVVKSIANNVQRAQEAANWQGTHLELPYPGRWKHHRITFAKALAQLLRNVYRAS